MTTTQSTITAETVPALARRLAWGQPATWEGYEAVKHQVEAMNLPAALRDELLAAVAAILGTN